MARKFSTSSGPSVHRIDLSCEQSGFTTPPADIHLKLLPPSAAGAPWTLLAHSVAGRPSKLVPWLREIPNVSDIRVEPGVAPRFMRAKVKAPPPAWDLAGGFVRVHHMDVGADGQCSWYVEGPKQRIADLVRLLESDVPVPAVAVRCRPVQPGSHPAPLSRRQFDALAAAVSMGYYDIPHRVDLRAIARRSGTSLGAMSELLRRAEAAILSHYVDASLMGWPLTEADPPNPFLPVDQLVDLEPMPAAPPTGDAAERRERTAKA